MNLKSAILLIIIAGENNIFEEKFVRTKSKTLYIYGDQKHIYLLNQLKCAFIFKEHCPSLQPRFVHHPKIKQPKETQTNANSNF
jgi:hypothetical protein